MHWNDTLGTERFQWPRLRGNTKAPNLIDFEHVFTSKLTELRNACACVRAKPGHPAKNGVCFLARRREHSSGLNVGKASLPFRRIDFHVDSNTSSYIRWQAIIVGAPLQDGAHRRDLGVPNGFGTAPLAQKLCFPAIQILGGNLRSVIVTEIFFQLLGNPCPLIECFLCGASFTRPIFNQLVETDRFRQTSSQPHRRH